MSNYYLAILLLFFTSVAQAQVGIGTSTVNSSAKLQVDATDKGFLPPRMLQAQRDAISSPASGLLIYQTDNTPGFYYFNGSTWVRLIVPTDNAANVTGTVAVANGGTGVTTSTGTGSVVLSNSPTLVTPALGTPSSATLTNATGLPISTGVTGLGTGVAAFLGTPSSSNLASAISNETGSGVLVFGTSPTLTTPTISSGSDQWATSINITPSTHATSRRASVWIDGWALLQDNNGSGTKDFSIYESAVAAPRLTINTSGNIGIGNNAPNARLDIRTAPTSTSDPGVGYLGIGTTTTTASTAGAGAVRYSTSSGGKLEYSNGSSWNTLTSNVQKSLVSGYLNANSYANTYFGDLAATEVIDVNNDFAASTFTAPRTGYYTFTVTLSSNNSNGANANGVWEVQVSPSSGNKMVSRFMMPADVASGYIATVTGAYTVQLSAGTTVKFQIYNSLGYTKTLAGEDYNRFSIVEN